jgi:hypothetical protein
LLKEENGATDPALSSLLVGGEVRKIPTLHSQFFYFAGIENYDYQMTDVIII